MLREAVASVIAQEYENWELCIVDDGSADQAFVEELTRLARSELRIRLRRRAVNGNVSVATNDAVAFARERSSSSSIRTICSRRIAWLRSRSR